MPPLPSSLRLKTTSCLRLASFGLALVFMQRIHLIYYHGITFVDSNVLEWTKLQGFSNNINNTDRTPYSKAKRSRKEEKNFAVGQKGNLTKAILRTAHLLRERKPFVDAFNACIDSALALLQVNQTLTKYTIYDVGYESVRTGWNKRSAHLQYPDIVTYPTSPQQVSLIVQCSKRTGHHVCGRNGKHSFEGDTCTYGVVVDVAKLNSVKKLGQNNIRFGSGFVLGQVLIELTKSGLTLPVGSCATVGLTGLVLVGGQGPLTRHLGLTSDYVSAIELVDHNGQIIYATASNDNSDYVWLARGGGSSVLHFPGIVTAIEFDNLPTLDVVNSTEKVYTTFRINYPGTVEQAALLLTSWQEFYLDPAHIGDSIFNRLTIEPWLFRNRLWDEQNELYITCSFYGNEILHQQFMRRLFPKIRNLVRGVQQITEVRRLSLLEFTQELAGVKDIQELSSGQHGWDLYEINTSRHKTQNRWKAYSAAASGIVSATAFRKLAEQIFDSQPSNRRYAELKPLGGAVKNKSQANSAFWHRNAIWWSLTSHWYWSTDPVELMDNIQQNAAKSHSEYVEAMGESYSGGYAGYVHHGKSTASDLKLYYGGNSARIAEIKKHRDPSDLFRLDTLNSV